MLEHGFLGKHLPIRTHRLSSVPVLDFSGRSGGKA